MDPEIFRLPGSSPRRGFPDPCEAVETDVRRVLRTYDEILSGRQVRPRRHDGTFEWMIS